MSKNIFKPLKLIIPMAARYKGNKKVYGGLVGVGAAIWGGGVYKYSNKAPITGRRRVLLITEDEARKCGDAAALNFAMKYKESQLSHDASLDKVLAKMINANPEITENIPKEDWKIRIIKERTDIDALSFPNGAIFITEGMLNFATSDDQRAILLGHEISHVVLSHCAELASNQHYFINMAKTGIQALCAMLGQPEMTTVSNFVLEQVFDVSTDAPHEAKVEKEADYVGLYFASKACYDPRAGVNFFNKLAKSELESASQKFHSNVVDSGDPEDPETMELIQQMPSWKNKMFANADRAKHILELQPQALKWRQESGKCEEKLPDITKIMGKANVAESSVLEKQVERLVNKLKASLVKNKLQVTEHRGLVVLPPKH